MAAPRLTMTPDPTAAAPVPSGPDDEPLERHLARVAATDLSDQPADAIRDALAEMVAHPQFPCLGARSVFSRQAITIVVLGDMTSPESIAELAAALTTYGREADPAGPFISFAAAFRGPEIESEQHFEDLLWQLLQELHDEDPEPWADDVERDPDHAHFAFSFAGVPYFIVGLHPQASRIARRAPLPTLVFNLHEQFELLRGQGTFERMRDRIRERDERLQGTVNPMARDHGEDSEARQYSGRELERDWEAPFTPRDP